MKRHVLVSLVITLVGLLAMVSSCQVPMGGLDAPSMVGEFARAATPADPIPVTSFVSVKNGQFQADGRPFFFAGTNNYYFMYKSNQMIDNVLYDAGRMGVKVIRSWAFMDGASHDGYSLQPQLGVYDDSGLERLDYAISRGKQAGIRFVLALVNYWSDFGGMPQYVQWLGLGSISDFYTSQQARTAYKNYVSHILNHVNRYTGIAYKDEPAIMGWNLTNEARNPGDSTGQQVTAWAREMSDFVHGIAPKHLISLGDEGFYNIYNDQRRGLTTIDNNDPRKGHQEYNGGGGVDFNAIIELPNIHYGVLHNYAQDWWSKDEAWSDTWLRDHIRDAKRVNKPIVLEEYSRKSVTDAVRASSMERQARIFETEGGSATMSWMLVSKMDDGILYRDRWDDGFQIAYGDITASMLTQHAITMWEKNQTGTSPLVNFPPAQAPSPTFPLHISNFESMASTTSLAQAWVRNGSGNAISPILVPGIIAGSTKAMALDWTLGSPNYAGVQHTPGTSAKKWSGADGIRLSYRADSASIGRSLTIQFRESSGEYFAGTITLESGTKTVFLPWSSFTHPGWYSGGNNTKDLDSIAEIALYLGGSAQTGRLIIDDIMADKSGDIPPIQNSILASTSVNYQPGSLSDIPLGITWNGNTVTSIRREGAQLTQGSDYTVTASGVTLRASYLETLTPGTTVTLAFFFSAGTSPNLAITVGQRPTQDAVLGSTSGSYTKGGSQGVAIGITFNGKTLSSIKNGGATLLGGSDYTSTANGVSLSSSWLNSLAVGTYTLGFTFSSGNGSTYTLRVLSGEVPTGGLTILYNNANPVATSIQAKPELKLVNSGTTSVPLKNIAVRYWLTNETNVSLQASIWWANRGQSSLVVHIGVNYVELTWPASTENLMPGDFVQIHFGINASNWSSFSQTNDYSYLTGMTSFVANPKITARLAGALVWGVEP